MWDMSFPNTPLSCPALFGHDSIINIESIHCWYYQHVALCIMGNKKSMIHKTIDFGMLNPIDLLLKTLANFAPN